MTRFDPSPRLRGRKGTKQRLRRLAQEPLCRHCRDKGITRAATTPDHVVPLAFGGSDNDANIQCLCDECHDIKSAGESASSQGAANHPDWLKPSAIPLEIVCGPPCSGKTTYIKANARPGDTVIDLDSIQMGLDPTYRHWTGSLTPELFNRAIRTRNAMLGSLSRATGGRAWFIVSAPSKAEQEWWRAKLGGKVTLLHPGVEECKRRALARGTPRAQQGVDAWERASRSPWEPKRPKPARMACDESGWPTDPDHPWAQAR